MNKKIVIATPVDMNNYGNRLQNYAVHRICEKLGFYPVTLAPQEKIAGFFPKYMLFKLAYPLRNNKLFNKSRKMAKFRKMLFGWEFTQNYINTIIPKNEKLLKNEINKAVLAGIGGDQIWSPYWAERVYFCGFSNLKSNKKICFAPSFGKANLSEDEMLVLKNKLTDIDNIAVREYSGIDIIKNITGKNARLIIDPVLMLSQEEWKKLFSENKVIEKKYIFSYFLGSDSSQKEYVEKLAKDKRLELIDILDVNTPEVFCSSPEKFVEYIANAELVCTDSYHGLLLSLLFERPFIIFQRGAKNNSDMSTRIETIVNMFNLKDRLYENLKKDEIFNSSVEMFHEKINKVQSEAWEYYNSFKE